MDDDSNPWGAPSPVLASPVPPVSPLPTEEVENDVEERDVHEWKAVDQQDAVPSREPTEEPKDDVDERDHQEDTVTTTKEEEAEVETAVTATASTEEARPAPPPRVDEEGFSEPPPTISRSLSSSVMKDEEEERPPMDDFDDIESGPTPIEPTVEVEAEAETDDFGDDDFNDFDAPSQPNADDDDDDFGDFGDFDQSGFDEVQEATPNREDTFADVPPPQPTPSFSSFTSTGYPPLRFNPTLKSSRDEIAQELSDFMNALYPGMNEMVSDEPERQVEGVGKVLANESTRTLLANLSSLPPLRPLDWRRSKLRRQHLIALGVPINLDDSAPIKPLASLVLPSQRSSSPRAASPTVASPLFRPPSRSTTPSTHAKSIPTLDRKAISNLLSLNQETLITHDLDRLRELDREMDRVSEQASGMLTFALTMREKQNADSETYNGMIQDLVAAAAKTKTTSAVGAARSSTSSSRWGRSTVK